MTKPATLTVLGAGSWGTAFAMHCARLNMVRLWARDGAQASAMQASRQNTRYLPGPYFPNQLEVTADLAHACADSDGVVLAVPVAAIPLVLEQLQKIDTDLQKRPHLLLSKGFLLPQTTITSDWPSHPLPVLVHQAIENLQPETPLSLLSGPSFAQEVAAGLPTAITLASNNQKNGHLWQQWLHSERFRTYLSQDPTGVGVGGALKNVMAIATGFCDGLALGYNARAALISRGLAEINRLSKHLGGTTETLLGLAGVGDLVLTCTSDLSRNRRVGYALAQGKPLEMILQDLGQVAEGVYAAQHAVTLAEHHNLAMPISQTVLALLQGRITPQESVTALLTRQPREEHL